MSAYHSSRRPGRGLARAFVAAATLTIAGCGGAPYTEIEEQAVSDWLTCIECFGEREFLRDSVGPGAETLLEEVLIAFPDRYRETMARALAAEWASVPGRDVDSATYVGYFLDNFEASAQRRTAQALGDRNRDDILRQALNQQGVIGYRPDVVEEIERSLVRTQPTVSTGQPATVTIQPRSISGLEVGQSRVVVAYVRDANGARVSDDVIWSFSPPFIVDVQRQALQRGNVAGVRAGTATVTATTANGVSDQIQVEVVAPPALSLVEVSGQPQTTAVTRDFPNPLVVRVLRGTAPVGGEPVRWSIVAGDATFGRAGTSTTTTSRGSGQATVRVVAGSTAGPVQVQAKLDNGPAVVFNLNVTR